MTKLQFIFKKALFTLNKHIQFRFSVRQQAP